MTVSLKSRLDSLRAKLARCERDAFITMNRANLRYLTGFTGSSGVLIFSAGAAQFVTDGRYREQAAREVQDCEVIVENEVKLIDKIALLVNGLAPGRLALSVEGDHLSVNQLAKLKTMLSPGIEVCPDNRMVEELREIKTPDEIASIRRAIAVAEAAFLDLLPTLQAGDTERTVMRRLRNLMEERGAEKESFETIVLFGARTSLPHGRPEDIPLSLNDLVLIDFGCFIEGYCSDITRTFCFGKPTFQMKGIFDVVQDANRRACAAVSANLSAKIVDQAARTCIEEAGHGPRFDHGTGHGIGLEIHESPRLAKTSMDTLRAGMAVTIEPGIYIPGWGGIRIEDDVLVTDKGAEILTSLPAEISPI